MEVNKLYPIEEYFMTKNRCYKANKRRTPTGIQVHSVGCKGTDRNRWRRWNTNTIEKCPNAFIDTNGIMQCLDWDVRPWLSGKGKNGNANDWCVGFEICEPSTANDTAYAAEYLYGCVVYLCTELCKMYGISPSNIKCHSELHADGVASNHADVSHWWGRRGTAWERYTMYTLRQDVAKNLGVPIVPDVKTVLRKGSVGQSVYLLQEKLNALGYDCGNPDGIFGTKTRDSVIAYQKDKKLAADGIVGPAT
jgi:N-acetyl-anhydromuramyl-L-alanine amidase AmpD